jgi:hypothetical protein
LRGALRNIGHVVGRNIIKRILKDHGIQPAPERGKRMPNRLIVTVSATSSTGAIPVGLQWISADRLSISYSAAARVFRKEARVRGVAISYAP